MRKTLLVLTVLKIYTEYEKLNLNIIKVIISTNNKIHFAV